LEASFEDHHLSFFSTRKLCLTLKEGKNLPPGEKYKGTCEGKVEEMITSWVGRVAGKISFLTCSLHHKKNRAIILKGNSNKGVRERVLEERGGKRKKESAGGGSNIDAKKKRRGVLQSSFHKGDNTLRGGSNSKKRLLLPRGINRGGCSGKDAF